MDSMKTVLLVTPVHKKKEIHEFAAAGIPGFAAGIHGIAAEKPGQLFLAWLKSKDVWHFPAFSRF